jgi:hypothetical protein
VHLEHLVGHKTESKMGIIFRVWVHNQLLWPARPVLRIQCLALTDSLRLFNNLTGSVAAGLADRDRTRLLLDIRFVSTPTGQTQSTPLGGHLGCRSAFPLKDRK